MNVEEFIQSFLEFECKNKMFSVKIRDVYIWHYIRVSVYYDLVRICGFAKVVLRESRKNDLVKTTWKNILDRYIIHNQFWAKQRDVLVIPHSRKYKDDEQYYKCIYTHLLDERLINSHYVLDTKSMENVYAVQKSHNILYCDLNLFNKIKRIKHPYEVITDAEINSKIVEVIEKYFDINVDGEAKGKWRYLINHYYNSRKDWISYYDYMLRKIKPKVIVMVVSYMFERMVLCEVAKRHKVPVVELQHGVISKDTIQYNFYQKMELPNFPDYIFSFGQFVKNDIRFPIESERIIPVGFPELERNSCLYQKNKTSKKVILFISESGVVEIAQYANTVVQKLNMEKYRVIFQLHPKEYYNWELTLGEYLKHSDIEIAGSFEHTIHETLAQADWVIGNYSTVLYEAQMFDAKTAVLKFGLYRNVEYLYENGYALLINSPEELVKAIEEDTFEPNKSPLFERNSLEKMQENIDRILNIYQ